MKKFQSKVATFSIIGYDPVTEELGVAVQSKFLGAGAVVPWAEAGAGAVATQSFANTAFGPEGIHMMKKGFSPEETAAKLVENDKDKNLRQFAVMDHKGNTAAFTGEECYEWAGHKQGKYCTAQGNILMNGETVDALVSTFEQSEGTLSNRLLAALEAAQNAGGDSRGKQSAALFVVQEGGGYGGYNDRKFDLRVDDHPEPIKELQRLHELHKLYFSQSDKEDLLSLNGEVLEEVETLLIEGNLLKEKQGKYNMEVKDAIQTYFMRENFEERWQEDMIDPAVLAFMRSGM
ncbi:DUF1028 domain-containing protein [Alkalicoccus halolimnae]|uniref:DUF1028 domain-containing protein n=1 Tax=Alkalicoccus halolimnae TaxID=1667239 RepID=A0A5C7FPE9_9BACI|nr:DUF1028 domain-containing protein [Alkalicoccus halolimnae]TXF86615.1 DUF1028 domain-containing protein [Alkalicoccus halolimnae]